MHMGAMAVIGKAAPENLVHVVINNEAHELVGGMPTAADTTDLCGVVAACGYRYCTTVEGVAALQGELGKIRIKTGPVFLEVKCAIGARDDLGRPTHRGRIRGIMEGAYWAGIKTHSFANAGIQI